MLFRSTRYAFVSPNTAPNKESDYPGQLAPVDDLPPATVITHVRQGAGGALTVRGSTADNGTVTRVLVNGTEAKALAPNFAEWEVTLANLPSGAGKLEARAQDAAGNVEPRPHVRVVNSAR